MAVIKSTVARRTVIRTYSSPVSPDLVPRSAISTACLFKLRNCSCLALWYSGMKIGPGGACWVLERIGAQPGCECGAILVAKAPLKELRGFFLTIQLSDEPTVEGVAVVAPLLSCQGGKTFSSDSEPSRLGVLLCTLSSPLRRWYPLHAVATGNEGEYHRFDNFNRFKTGLRRKDVLAHLVQFSDHIAHCSHRRF
jgi:hypothetical protein